MRIFLTAGTAALAFAIAPTALSAQQTANQANAEARPAPPTTTGTSTPGGPAVVTRNNPGNFTPPPAQANKTYPVCTRTLTDNCQNPGEGGAPGRSRALDHWPGEPASERSESGN